MSKLNLQHVLDEILILHGSIALRLLNDFPDVHGVSFTLSRERSYAMAKLDVPAGYVDGYREPKLEALATYLLKQISPRMNDLYDALSPVADDPEDIYLNAYRNGEEVVYGVLGGINVSGSIVGKLGTHIVRRLVIVLDKRILAIEPTVLTLVCMAEEDGLVDQIERAAQNGIAHAWQTLNEKKLFLGSEFIKQPEIKRLKRWLDHFPNPNERVSVELQGPVCFVSTTSEDRKAFLAVVDGDPFADALRKGTPNSDTLEVLVYHPETGFKQEDEPEFKVR
jgi:hypothetical protein